MASEQEILVEQGEQAETLLADPVFSSVVNELVDQTFQSFVNSQPQEADKREQSYRHYRALVDVVSTLKQRVAVRDGIVDANNKEMDHE